MPFHVTEAALARIVMPRSRSWSLESMTRSTRASWDANTPAAPSMASTRVVLPWSTCAINATFRKEGEGMCLDAIDRIRVPRVATSDVALWAAV